MYKIAFFEEQKWLEGLVYIKLQVNNYNFPLEG